MLCEFTVVIITFIECNEQNFTTKLMCLDINAKIQLMCLNISAKIQLANWCQSIYLLFHGAGFTLSIIL